MSFGYNVTVHNDILKKNRYKKINRQQVLIHMPLIVLLDSQEYVKTTKQSFKYKFGLFKKIYVTLCIAHVMLGSWPGFQLKARMDRSTAVSHDHL